MNGLAFIAYIKSRGSFAAEWLASIPPAIFAGVLEASLPDFEQQAAALQTRNVPALSHGESEPCSRSSSVTTPCAIASGEQDPLQMETQRVFPTVAGTSGAEDSHATRACQHHQMTWILKP
eukprot:303487-Amphidinium_carterae.1